MSTVVGPVIIVVDMATREKSFMFSLGWTLCAAAGALAAIAVSGYGFRQFGQVFQWLGETRSV